MAANCLALLQSGLSADGPIAVNLEHGSERSQTSLVKVDCMASRDYAERYGKILDFDPRKTQQNQRFYYTLRAHHFFYFAVAYGMFATSGLIGKLMFGHP